MVGICIFAPLAYTDAELTSLAECEGVPSRFGKGERERINKISNPVGKALSLGGLCALGRALNAAGVKVSIITDSPVTPLEHLPMCAGFAYSEGLPYEAAWRAITINPATSTGIGDRVGSLEVGKDGDVVIWQADPLKTIGAEALVTIVDGKIVHKA